MLEASVEQLKESIRYHEERLKEVTRNKFSSDSSSSFLAWGKEQRIIERTIDIDKAELHFKELLLGISKHFNDNNEEEAKLKEALIDVVYKAKEMKIFYERG